MKSEQHHKYVQSHICVFTSLVLMIVLYAQTGTADLREDRKVVVDGVERTYDIYLPEVKSNDPLAVVLLFHGHGGDSRVMTGANGKRAPYKKWLSLADEFHFAVVIPNGVIGPDGHRGWNDCRADNTTNPSTNDVAFTSRLLDTLGELIKVDRKRVYAVGTSNGGNMALRLAMEVPEVFASVAAVVASMPVKSSCLEKRVPLPILFMNGTLDPILPYNGGRVGKERAKRGTVLSTEQSVQYWLKVNGVTSAPTITDFPNIDASDNSTVRRYWYKSNASNFDVVLYEIIGGGHTEPSKTEKYRRIYKMIVGPQNYDVEMADEIWSFFSRNVKQ